MIPHVHILMCTKDGAGYLAAQLASIAAQSHKEWSLWISDDGSRDTTLEIIAQFQAVHPGRSIALVKGPQSGVAANFLSLLVRPEHDACWIAFADQDDIWMPHKIARAVDMIGRGTGAQIYGSSAIVVDAAMGVTGSPRHYRRPFEFGNALVQNVLRGNTLVMPPRVTDHLRAALNVIDPTQVPFHDWWVYQVGTGAGFDVLYDNKPGLFYRQHGRNVMGAQQGHVALRARVVVQREFAGWVDANIEILQKIAPVLTAPNQRLLHRFAQWRSDPRLGSRAAPRTFGVYRQTAAGDLALQTMARLGLI